jgi:hypothetical protein
MQDVRNLEGRKICMIDPENKTVVIVIKGVETSIRFNDDGTYDIIDRKLVA